jgi:hypothetical protein
VRYELGVSVVNYCFGSSLSAPQSLESQLISRWATANNGTSSETRKKRAACAVCRSGIAFVIPDEWCPSQIQV